MSRSAGRHLGSAEPRALYRHLRWMAHPRDLTALRAELRAAMSAGAGLIRGAQSLAATERVLEAAAQALGPAPAPTRDAVELANLITVGRLIARSARLRQESRGAHWRDDFPHPSPSWEGVRLRLQLAD